MAKEGKIFAVQLKGGASIRLVKARGPISARAFVADGMIEVRPATAEEIYSLASRGVMLENAEGGAETALPAPGELPAGMTHIRGNRSN